MKKLIILLSVLVTLIFSQQERAVNSVRLKDSNSIDKYIPFLGEKVIILFYLDPDVREIQDPLAEALEAANFPSEKFAGIGVINCKDTWIPNYIIKIKAREKQERFPTSYIFVDENHILASAWNLSNSNNSLIVLLIGKDSKIKNMKILGSYEEGKSFAALMIDMVWHELNK